MSSNPSSEAPKSGNSAVEHGSGRRRAIRIRHENFANAQLVCKIERQVAGGGGGFGVAVAALPPGDKKI